MLPLNDVSLPCESVNPEVFFPGKRDRVGELYAKKVCAGCPSREKTACLETALVLEAQPDFAGRHGVWGGLTGDERSALVAKRTGGVA